MQAPPPTNLVTYRGTDMPDVIATVETILDHPGNLSRGEYHGSTRMAGKDAHGS